MFQYFRSNDWSNSENELTTYNAVLSGAIAELAAGELGVAVGVQYRDESHIVDRESIINRGKASFSGQSLQLRIDECIHELEYILNQVKAGFYLIKGCSRNLYISNCLDLI